MPGHVNLGGVSIYAPSAPPGSGPGGAITLQDAYEGGNSIAVSPGQGGPVTISGDSATVGLLFTSTAKQQAIQIYNTADQTTNYERLAIRWESNIARVIAEKAAGGTERVLQLLGASGNTGLGLEVSSGFFTWIGSSGNAVIHKPNGEPVGFQHRSRITTSTVQGHAFINDPSGTGYSASSGTQTFAEFQITINQSGTAGYNGLYVNVTETTVGSGAKRVFRIDVSGVGTPAFCILNGGQVQAVIGSSSAPTYSFIAETGMGMYRAASGDLRFATASTDRIGALAPSADETTALFIQVQDTGGGLSFVRVTCGADGSGGGANKLLRVPN